MARRVDTVRSGAVVVGALLALVAGWQLLTAGQSLRDVADRAQAATTGPTDDVEVELGGQRSVLGIEVETVGRPVQDGFVAVDVLGGADAAPGDTITVAVVAPDLPALSGIERPGADADPLAVSRRALAATIGAIVLLAVGLLGLFALVGMRPATTHRGPVYISRGPT